MKTELLALIDELVKFKLHAAEGKFSAEKDARQIRSNIEFLLGQPQSPEFDFAAKLKLEDLLARGYTVSGLALEKPAADGRPERGFITAGGFVGWWRDRSPAVVEPVGFKPLEWTESLPPVEGCAYDHVKAKTSLGEASIEWKDWKICTSYVAYLRDEYIGVGTTLNEAKELVAAHLYSMVAGLLAAPVTKPKGFALVPLRLTGAMNQVLETEGWQWQDLLAEAESITEEEYAWIAAGNPAAAPIALTLAELLEIRRAGEDFESHGETDVDGELLIRGAQAGYLECTHFQMLDESALDRDIQAAQAIQKPDPT